MEAVRTERGMGLEEVARAKYGLRTALRDAMHELRLARASEAFRQALLPTGGTALPLSTSRDAALVMREEDYVYRSAYSGAVEFQKHAFRVVGDLEPSGEEHDCAVHPDRSAFVTRWVRNTDRQRTSFSLHTSTDRFYPDFLAELADGRHLVVEYKGRHLATSEDTREKNLIGEVWADRSGGRCLYLMVTERRYEAIDRAVGR